MGATLPAAMLAQGAMAAAGVLTDGVILDGTAGTYVSTPDSAALSITNDIDVRVCLSLDNWGLLPGIINFMSKYDNPSGAHSFILRYVDGRLTLLVSSAGSNNIQVSSSALVGAPDGSVRWGRATCDLDDGAGNAVFSFYVSDQPASTSPDSVVWTLLGGPVLRGVVAGIHDSTTEVRLGARNPSVSTENVDGVIYYAEIRDGIDGTIVANSDFRPGGHFSLGSPQGTDDHGNVWTLAGNAQLVAA